MKIGIVAFINLFMCFASHSQEFSITGSVNDPQGHPIVQADVILKNLKDEIQTYTVTDSLGKFKLYASAGKYRLALYHLAYQPYSDTLRLIASSEELKLSLVPKQENLSEVVITAKKPLLEKKLDRLVINVENQPAFVGKSALELLQHSPGIYTTGNGELQMLGKSGVRLLLNGRLQYLSGQELQDFLSSLSADEIVNIELLTTPPSNYEAEGNAGYLNIITKKAKKEAWKLRTGIHYEQGKYSRVKANVGLQYQMDKLTTHINYNSGKINSFENIAQYNRFGPPENRQHYRSFNKERRHTFYQHIRSQLDWELNKNSSLSLASRILVQQGNRPGNNQTFQVQENGAILQEINTTTLEKRVYVNYSNDLYYEYQLDTLGKKFMINGSWAGFGLQDQQAFLNTFDSDLQETLQEQLRSDFDNTSSIKAIKLDFLLPYSKSTWETGLKYTFTKAINSFVFENYEDSTWEIDTGLTNDFTYREQNAAAYLSFQTKLSEKWQLKAGIRAEYTDTKGISPTLEQVNKYDYFQLFPTFYLQYEWNENYQMDLAYSRRINRPDYSSLNPFITYQSPLFSNQGNPLLRPEFTHSVEWNHTWKHRYIFTPFYNYTEAYYSEVPLQLENSNETRYTFGNLGTYQNIGLQIILPVQLSTTLDWQHSFIGVYQSYRLSYQDIRQEPEGFFWRYQSSLSVKFSDAFHAEISGYYESSSLQAFYRSAPRSDVSLGATYKFLQEKAQVSFSVADVFYTHRAKVNIEYPQQALGFYRRNDTRRVQLGFSYEFGQATKEKKTFTSASEEEQSRG